MDCYCMAEFTHRPALLNPEKWCSYPFLARPSFFQGLCKISSLFILVLKYRLGGDFIAYGVYDYSKDVKDLDRRLFTK